MTQSGSMDGRWLRRVLKWRYFYVAAYGRSSAHQARVYSCGGFCHATDKSNLFCEPAGWAQRWSYELGNWYGPGAQWLCNTELVQALFRLATAVLAAGADATDRLASSLEQPEGEAADAVSAEQLAAAGVFACNVRTALLGLQEASSRPQVRFVP